MRMKCPHCGNWAAARSTEDVTLTSRKAWLQCSNMECGHTFTAALTVLEPANDVSWATAPMPLLGLGPEAPFWVSLAVGDWLVKLAMALVALLPFRLAIAKLTARVA